MKKSATCFHVRVLVMLSLLSIADTAHAQAPPPQNPPTSWHTVPEKDAGVNYHASFAGAEFASHGQVVVQGVPFSATAVKETTQILSDGRRLVRRSTARLYRDSEGRTRHELMPKADQPEVIASLSMIYDAVTGTTYMLNPRRRRALQLSPLHTDAAPRRVRIITPQTPPGNQLEVVGGAEALGRQIIEGVAAEGVRSTTTIPAGTVGNKEPITVVYERWYSPELRRNVLIKRADTDFAEAVYRLTDSSRSEPPKEMFAVQAGYTVEPLLTGTSTRNIKSRHEK